MSVHFSAEPSLVSSKADLSIAFHTPDLARDRFQCRPHPFPHQGLGFVLSWSSAGLGVDGHSLVCHPAARRKEKFTTTVKDILALLCAAGVPSALLMLTPLSLLQPCEKGIIISPILQTRKPRTSGLPKAYPLLPQLVNGKQGFALEFIPPAQPKKQ